MLVVVLEEYAGLIAAMEGVDKKKVNELKRIVGRLLREGAKAGITCFTEKCRKAPCFSYGYIRRTVYTNWQLV